MMLRGGPRTQIFQTKRCLERLAVHVSLFDSWQELKRTDVDLVHIFGANIGTYHLARVLRLQGIPFVLTPIFYTRRSMGIVKLSLAADKFVRKFVKGFWSDYAVIAEMSRWAKAVLPNTVVESLLYTEAFGVPPERMTVVPNGVEKRFYFARPQMFSKRFGVRNFILNVGHIGPGRKNVLRLVQALEGIDRQAVIMGRMERSEAAKEIMDRAKKNPRLKMLESIPHSSDLLASAFAACDVFVLPSMFETPGLAALEAALAGAKIVITPHGGTKDYFGEQAEYVDPYSIDSIRKGIQNALRKNRDSGLRERIRKEFLWERVAEKTKAVYEKVLTNKKGAT
ncbi:MAG: glycosyltransferase [Ignavibacteriales bacterium]|nr:glycosyltransferase [Ignavibacteriales bacterium]